MTPMINARPWSKWRSKSWHYPKHLSMPFIADHCRSMPINSNWHWSVKIGNDWKWSVLIGIGINDTIFNWLWSALDNDRLGVLIKVMTNRERTQINWERHVQLGWRGRMAHQSWHMSGPLKLTAAGTIIEWIGVLLRGILGCNIRLMQKTDAMQEWKAIKKFY